MIRYRLAIGKKPIKGKIPIFVDLCREKGSKSDGDFNFKYFSDKEKTLRYLENILSYLINTYSGDFHLEGGPGTAEDPIVEGLVQLVKKYEREKNLEIEEPDEGEALIRLFKKHNV